jgi:hypothetical protein
MGCEEVDYSTGLKDFFRRTGAAIRVPSIGWTSSQSLNSVERWIHDNMHYFPTLELIKEWKKTRMKMESTTFPKCLDATICTFTGHPFLP